MPRRIILAVLLVLSIPGLAQGIADIDSPRSNMQVLALGLYPPDMIMRHQQALGITDAQRKAMLALVRDFQSDVAELQWNLESEQQQMRELLASDRIDTDEAMPRVEKVLAMESEFKRAHFRLLIAIKNELTAEQLAMIKDHLRERRKSRAAR